MLHNVACQPQDKGEGQGLGAAGIKEGGERWCNRGKLQQWGRAAAEAADGVHEEE